MTRTEERVAWKANGFLFLLLEIFLLLAGAGLVIYGIGIIFLVVAVLLLPGFVMIQPNEARVLTFFGKYAGTIAEDGFFWANPFASKKKISLRVRNFHSDKLKVNDADGNPILIGAVIVWKVVDSAKALFDVEDFNVFVAIQSETAIRSLASRYPYDRHDQSLPSLMGAPEEVAENLCTELQERLKIAGVEILEARISHLAYAPEIAQAMLRRQQAQAVIAARQKIVEGAIGMVEMALDHIEKKGVVELDEERKAAMVNNLMVALVSEGETTPVINTGTLFT
ncbi:MULTISPECIES: SPFH domain-containing protein [Thermoactinomyces]|uniref:SPFH domain-containing protein n=1 Tax=Thermoactinomyces daqus TaxID=1329516 RepID=A0A7W2AGK6_9BACL|nr:MULTISPECIES: SPFH domain-containing protein [Thermoactinomyces]MBA4541756.1 SPFH domain-containing protein [Thermoactinomyces daqus]MBH8602718.1 SPFH domain-containing protein [Thermoactinomyces sp. CICC 10522]MBH8606171.1 SPFH domain-containing protein [Thermoactinomyces sp. CICC 10521]